MLTPEQIKNLKPGDKLITNVHFCGLEKGYVCCTYSPRPADFEPKFYFNPASLSLPPKHDPCRLFKKGDKVRVVKWNGREIARMGEVGTVVANEHNARVELSIGGWSHDIFYPACHLELVTPVEELGPYVVRLDTSDGVEEWIVEPRNNNLAFVAVYGDAHPHAKEAAEAERDRLNAEYRKEHANAHS